MPQLLSTPVKPELFKSFASIDRAMLHGLRLELLAPAESPVGTLVRTQQPPVVNFSQYLQHLQQLKQAGRVVARREGRSIFYSPATPRWPLSGLTRCLSARSWAVFEGLPNSGHSLPHLGANT